jgi:ATPases involved in chromosome partitioning
MDPTMNSIQHKAALLMKLEKMKSKTRVALDKLEAGAKKKFIEIENDGYKPISFSLNQVRNLPELTHVKAESAIAALKNKGREFSRDEDKATRPWCFTLQDIRLIYDEAGIPTFKQRLESAGRYDGASVMGVINLKGGVGKSTTTTTLGAGLVHSTNLLPYRMKVLFVDLDPQGSISVAFGYKGIGLVQQNSAIDAIRGQVSKETLMSWIQPTSSDGLYILPASRTDAFFSIKAADYAKKSGVDETQLLERFVIEPLRNEFDAILIDCGPHLDSTLLNITECADSIIIPAGLDPLEFDSTLKFVDGLYDLYEMVPSPRLNFENLKFIASKYDETNPIHIDNYRLMMMTYPGQVLAARMANLRAFNSVFDDKQTVYTAQPKFYPGDPRALKLRKAVSVADQVVTEVFSSMLNGVEPK